MEDKCILDPERDCIGKAAAAKLEARLGLLERTVEKNHDNASRTHKEFFERIRTIETATAVQTEQYKTILEKLDALTDSVAKVTSSVSDIQAEPGRDWKDLKKSIRWAVLAAIIAAVMGFLLGKVGL